MKKQILVSLVGVALIGVGVTVHAQVVPGTPPAPASIVAPTPAAINAPAPVPSGTVSTGPINIKTEKQARLEGVVATMENSLQARITNLDDLAARIQSRIGKMQQEGKDMTAALAALANAQKAIAAAKTDLATFEKRVATMTASKSPRAGFAAVKRSATLGVATKIKLAHKALVDTVVIMKGQGSPVTASPAATSSTSTIR